MSEIALVSARKSRLETDAKKGSKAAGTALKLANSPDIFLATIQIGITLVGILTGLYSGDVLAQRFAPVIAKIGPLQPYSVVISQTLIVVVVTYLTLIIGELVPKRIGMTAAEKVSKLVARPMYLFSRIGRPFVWLLSCSTNGVMRMIGLDKAGESKVTEEEIKAIIQEGAEDGEVQEVEQELVERVFNLGDRNVGSIMTHRSELVWLNISDDNEQTHCGEQPLQRLSGSRPYARQHRRRGLPQRPVRQAGHAGLHPAAGIAPGQVHPGKTERL